VNALSPRSIEAFSEHVSKSLLTLSEVSVPLLGSTISLNIDEPWLEPLP
jgi:hypothetical protein